MRVTPASEKCITYSHLSNDRGQVLHAAGEFQMLWRHYEVAEKRVLRPKSGLRRVRFVKKSTAAARRYAISRPLRGNARARDKVAPVIEGKMGRGRCPIPRDQGRGQRDRHGSRSASG